MTSPHFKPENCALIVVDHQISTVERLNDNDFS
jgi:hypothetical protein